MSTPLTDGQAYRARRRCSASFKKCYKRKEDRSNPDKIYVWNRAFFEGLRFGLSLRKPYAQR